MSDAQTPIYDSKKPKERAFVDAYIAKSFNATAAARAIGLKNPRQRGAELWANRDIKAAVDERLRQGRASADMVRARLEEQAFSSLGDCLRFVEVEVVSPDNPMNREKKTVVSLDLSKARRLRKLHLLSKIKERRWWDKSKDAEVVEIEVENYSAQAALLALGKGHGIFEKEEKPAETSQGGITLIPMRGQLTDEERARAANELEPR